MFIEHTLDFIEGSDLEFSWPEIRTMKIDSDGGRAINLTFACSLSVNQLKNNHVLSHITIFSLFDALVDLTYPSIEGQSFKRRYDQLPSCNNRDVIFRETYRILKLLRNAVIHNRSSLHMGEHGVALSYMNRGTLFSLQCTKKAVILLNTIVVLFIKSKNSPDEYSNQYLYSYFNEMISEVSMLADEFCNGLSPVANSLNFKTTVRYRITNTVFTYCSKNNRYKFELYNVPEKEAWAGYEYEFNIDERKYVVPEEAIEPDGYLYKKGLSKWIITNESVFQ